MDKRYQLHGLGHSQVDNTKSNTSVRAFVFFRELAFQISEQFEALGSLIGVKCGTYYVV